MLMPALFTNDLMDGLFGNECFAPEYFEKHDQKLMSTDVKETENGYELSINMPGYELEDIKGEVKDGYLTVSATHNSEKEEKDKKKGYIRRERYTGSCSRSFYVGEAVTQEDIKAKYKNGVLIVDVPKKEEKEVPENRYIMIEG